MRNKPKKDWHNFSFSNEQRIGVVRAFGRWDNLTHETFLRFAKERIAKKTGIRFKLNAKVSQKIVGDVLCIELKKPTYIFPNVSSHTGRYDSRYNRLETYVPNDKWPGIGKEFVQPVTVDVALSINKVQLPKFLASVGPYLAKGEGVSFVLEGNGAFESVNKGEKYCGDCFSVQIYSLDSLLLKTGPGSLEKEPGYGFYIPACQLISTDSVAG